MTRKLKKGLDCRADALIVGSLGTPIIPAITLRVRITFRGFYGSLFATACQLSRPCTAHKEIIKLARFSQIKGAGLSF
jgi:hypothetical protein